MTDPSRFTGLAEHMERHLGEVTHAQPPDLGGRNRGFAIGFHRHPEREMVSAASTGVRFQEVEARMPEGFVCSALPDQDFDASYLVHVVADRVVQSGKGHEYGGGYLNDEPLIPDTEVVGLMALPHPYMPDDFHIFRDEAGASVLQVITLIPVTLLEYHFMREHDLQALVAHWRDKDTDILDIHRPSAI
ncbi:hypothetical protein E1281_05415 [Actinomadura sp. KC345]|uniref:suppressor of fused domain protein n=1 Tax=Actinomadura sp. KC345 TaxID=2530371 RepID=UPI001048C230|nr:suppressor of fused domain protein [Actinomadura sp. KC345]TDC57318.1 hypothetical protein E1281_05415 [Actinomadura sp. KC345]